MCSKMEADFAWNSLIACTGVIIHDKQTESLKCLKSLPGLKQYWTNLK